MNREPAWLTLAKRIQALATTGLHYGAEFGGSPFDRERYAEIAELAAGLIEQGTGFAPGVLAGLLPQPAEGHPTPKVDVRAALIEQGRVLLVREVADGRWTLPGGFAETGLSAAANAEKEMWEEAGLRVRAHRLYALRHKAGHPYPPDVREFYKLFFLCERTAPGEAVASTETDAVGWFAPDELPDLSLPRTLPRDILDAFAHQADPGRLPEID